MYKRIYAAPAALVAAALILTSCSTPLGPDRQSENNAFGPRFATVAPPVSNGLVLDQWNGSLMENPINPGTCDGNNPCFIKGFNPKNPHVGDVIVATFFWTGSTNIITSVTDHLTDVARTPVGNQYTLINYSTDGNVSMATYVATNVQNFPDTSTDYSKILAVRANLSAAPTDGGVVMAAYSGLQVTIGASSSAQGSDTMPVAAAAGPVSAAAGGLVYSVTMSGTLVGLEHPAAPFADVAEMSDNFMKSDAEYAVLPNGGTVNPQWTWFFSGPRGNWLASSVALNPKATRLVFTTQPSTTLPLMTITPAVQVQAVDDLGNTVANFTGSVTIAIGHNGGLVLPGTLSGTKTLNFVNGVATFSDLSIDQAGNGYTLVVTGSGLKTAESAPFNIGAL
ncbi:MAG TPA: hypothetical protein VG454_10840 [Gemmatimonadales bacterium]|nr:hypothetical protein [Gemmatimonadales bacterium]